MNFEELVKQKLGEIVYALWQAEMQIRLLTAELEKVKVSCPGEPTT